MCCCSILHILKHDLSRSVDVSHTLNETFDETSDRGMEKQLNSYVMDTRSHPLPMKLDSDRAGARFPALIEALPKWRSSKPTVHWPLGRKRSTDGHNKNRSLLKH